MRAKDSASHGFAIPGHHGTQTGSDAMPLGEEEGTHPAWANDLGDSFPSNWEAAWIDLGGEG